MIKYGFYKELDKTFEQAAEVILPAIKKYGFTIVTQIDLKQKFQEKLNKEHPQYTVLGLCHPETAYQAVQTEANIGLFLPCNMVVYEKGTKTAVSLIKPTFIMSQLGNPELVPLAEQLEDKLTELFNAIE